MAYVGTLALLAILGIHLWDQLPVGDAIEPPAKAGWSLAERSHPAFAVSQFDLPEKTETYEIFRHPDGRPQGRHSLGGGRREAGRKAGRRTRNLSPRRRIRPLGAATADLAARMDPKGAHELEAAGVIDSKFGSVTLFRHPGEAAAQSCLGFLKRLDDPGLQISGWSCQGDALPAQRAAIGCMLNRLILLTAGNDPKLAELFARAELRRTNCATTARVSPLGGLGDVGGKPAFARRRCNRCSGQAAGFQATFRIALHYSATVWPV